MIVASRNGYVVDDDPARLDLDVLHGFLRTSYWSPGVPREVVERAVANDAHELYRSYGFTDLADPSRFLVRQVAAAELYSG
jgi:hypothetical protein